MASVNKVIVVGNLGRDPEVRYAASGAAICKIAVATSRKWKDKASGEMQEETEWHRVVLFDRQAEVAGEYLKKGSPVYIEGRLKTRKWEDKDGVERYTTEINTTEMQLLGGRDGERDGGDDRGDRGNGQRSSGGRSSGGRGDDDRRGGDGQGRSASQQRGSQGNSQGDGRPKPKQGGFDDMDDDIPF